MAVGLSTWPGVMHPVAGVKLGVAAAGVKHANRNDVLLVAIDEGASVSGVFTQSAFAAAPVILGREHLALGDVRFLVVNSGNANACTGEKGLADARATCESIAQLTGVRTRQVIPFSTGVIGEFLPVDKIVQAIPQALATASEAGWDLAGRTIMTTDTRPKGASVQFDYDGETVTVTGIAKGAGMIRPNMATMLAYIATDAVVAQAVLDTVLKKATDRSFNRITVDGDTSTNDACILIATGQVGLPMLTSASGPLYDKLLAAVTQVQQLLAQAIVRDGEGATKFVTVAVQGGGHTAECLQVAYAIAHSPLIKTAIYASDPNWGRIVAAVGYAGIKGLDPALVSVWLDEVLIVDRGGRAATYTEALGAAVVAQAEFVIRVDLGRGDAQEQVWTCDLSHEYVTINAEYRS
jgi:glutamate N-acetyltransferase / amino-acid N-acetyltransferase